MLISRIIAMLNADALNIQDSIAWEISYCIYELVKKILSNSSFSYFFEIPTRNYVLMW